jgi:uncharacterized NAD(P)/FAD-binding protein YdhS
MIGTRTNGDGGADLVLVGGGMSNAAILLSLTNQLQSWVPWTRMSRIIVVDRLGELGGGTAYRACTPPRLLLNSSAKRLDSTGLDFSPWLADRTDDILAELESTQDPPVTRWLREHRGAVRSDQSSRIFYPRRFFGAFLRDRVGAAARALARAGVEVNHVVGEVVDAWQEGRVWRLRLADRSSMGAAVLVLGIGADPEPIRAGLDGRDDYIATGDHATCLDRVVRIVRQRAPADRRLVVLGSAAAAMEFLYCAASDSALQQSVSEVVIVSKGGRLPDGLPSGRPVIFEPTSLLSLARLPDDMDSRLLADAAVRDMAEARSRGYTAVDVHPRIKAAFMETFRRLTDTGQAQFVRHYSGQYRALMRRTSPAYARAVNHLHTRMRVTHLVARIEGIEADQDLSVRACSADGEAVRIGAAAIVDCRGPATDPALSRSALLNNLLTRRTVALNATGKGLEVDSSFAAAPRLLVLGPLLAGTRRGRTRVSHCESAPRIYEYASELSAGLVRLFDTREAGRGALA